MTVLLAIGTGKGLFLARSEDNRRTWQISGPDPRMTSVYSVMIDVRRSTPRLLAGVSYSHFGPTVLASDDLGGTWLEPDTAPIAFPPDTGASLANVWQLAPGPADHPDRVYAGVQPTALFVSDDGGLTYHLVRSLWEHPHREHWTPGFGGAAVHTVLPHPAEPASVLVAMSTGGVYRTVDGGGSWTASNTGIKAYFLPDQFPEYGQCVHKVARDPTRPERLFAQNHHGVYRSDDGGTTWVSVADGLPSDFGFPVVCHPHRSDVAYLFPLTADSDRYPVDHRCRVYRTEDAGATWTPLDSGLPQEPYFPSVLRDAMCVDDADPAGVYFGTRSGEVYASADEGEHWTRVAANLPDVLCVRAATI